MTHFLLVAAMVVATIPATPAMALRSYFKAQQLLDLCKSSETVDFGRCIGYFEGIVDAWEMDRSGDHLKQCIDDKAVPDVVWRAFYQFMEAHPDQGQLPAAIQVTRAAREKFCKV